MECQVTISFYYLYTVVDLGNVNIKKKRRNYVGYSIFVEGRKSIGDETGDWQQSEKKRMFQLRVSFASMPMTKLETELDSAAHKQVHF